MHGNQKMKTYIIAEAGVNHNGDINLAYKLIDNAKNAGADCIKFQTFNSKSLVSPHALMADYQLRNTRRKLSQFEMLKKLELSIHDFSLLNNYCKKLHIDFMSTPFDIESVNLLKSLNMNTWKIPSGEITNLPYLEEVSKLNKPIILSTGMATLEEVKKSFKIIRKFNNKPIILLHCTSEYPTPYNDVNLHAMLTLKNVFKTEIGYSDHTLGFLVPVIAVSMGAVVIEKHLTLDKGMVGPDHKASLEPKEFKEMVVNIRNVELILGSYEKKPSNSEIKNIPLVRKSIVAKKNINKGEKFTLDNLTTKRPTGGLSPMNWYKVIGKIAKKKFKIDDFIEL
jgi:N,N'-diacetyllegionaminate synthase